MRVHGPVEWEEGPIIRELQWDRHKIIGVWIRVFPWDKQDSHGWTRNTKEFNRFDK